MKEIKTVAILLHVPPPLVNSKNPQTRFFYSSIRVFSKKYRCRTVREKAEEIEKNNSPSPPSSAEEVTKKYGLEVGLWKILSSKDDDGEGIEGENKKKKLKTDQVKELLAKYGGAYLATSITFSLISFSLCYVLVSNGVDVQPLLSKVKISTSETGEKVGAFALAYTAHKSRSLCFGLRSAQSCIAD